MLLIVPALIPLIPLLLGLDYLRRQLLPQAPATTPQGEPYTPPFSGGQCIADYRVFFKVVNQDNGNETLGNDIYRGAIGGVFGNGTASTGLITGNGNISLYENQPRNFLEIVSVERVGGLPDDCGDLPNPNPTPPIPSDGVADSPPLEVEDDDLVVEGAPIVPYNPLSAALAALLAALKAASDLKDAIDFIGDMLDKIGKGIDEVKDWLDDKNKNPDSGKDVKRHDYGSIRKDGFLRLFPSGELNGFTPEYLDLQLLSIPVGYGKYFGDLSPNFYRFKSLGYISFVSPSFGNLQTVEIEFSRCSINIPDNAYGFFYHLGLEDVIRANVSLFYSIDKEEE